MFFIRLVLVQMRLREKVGLVLLAVIFYETACSLCVPYPVEENPFEKYMNKIQRGKIQSIPKHGINDKENGRKSIDVLSESTLLNDLRKEKRRKRKNKPNEKVYSRDDVPSTSIPDSLRNQEPSFYFNEMGLFPEVKYPLTASETWAPSYWSQPSSNKEEAYYSRDDNNLVIQNKKQKKKNIEAFLQPSIMKTILKAQEKKAETKPRENHNVISEVNKKVNETIIRDFISASSSKSKETQEKQKKSKPPLAKEKSLKKIVTKAQHATSASKKLLTESIASHSRSKPLSKNSKSNYKEFIIHESDANKTTNATIIVLPIDHIASNDQIEIIVEDSPVNKESASKIIENLHDSKENNNDALIDIIKANRVMTDNDSNQLELLLAITASDSSADSNPAYASDEKVLQTSSKSHPKTILFSDSIRQNIFDVLSTEKLNASSLRDKILNILLTENHSPTLSQDTLSNDDGLSIKNLTNVDRVEFPSTVTQTDISEPPATEETPETAKELNSDSSWTDIHYNDGSIETTTLTETMLETPLANSTRSGELETTSEDDSIPEIPIIPSVKIETKIPSSNENKTDLFITNELAGNLREIISKPSDSHSLVHDLREIIRLLTIWNTQIDDVDNNNNNPDKQRSTITLTKETTTNDTLTDEGPEIVFVNSESSKENKIVKVSQITDSETPKDDQTDVVSKLTSTDADIVSGSTTVDNSTNDSSVNTNPLHTSSHTSNVANITVPESSTRETLIDDQTDTDTSENTSETSGIDIVPMAVISIIPSKENSTLDIVDTPSSTLRNDQFHLVSMVSTSHIPVQDQYNKTPVSTNNILTDDQSSLVSVTTLSDTPVNDQSNIICLAKTDNQYDHQSYSLEVETPSKTESPYHIDKSPEAKSSDTPSDNSSVTIPATTENDTRKDEQPDGDLVITPIETPTGDQAHIEESINNNRTDNQFSIVPAAILSKQNDIVVVSTTNDTPNDERSDALSNISKDVPNIIVPVSIVNENLVGNRSDTASLNSLSDLPTNEDIFIVPDGRTHDWTNIVPKDTLIDTPETDQIKMAPVITSSDERLSIVPAATITDPQTFVESTDDPKESGIALTDSYGLIDKSAADNTQGHEENPWTNHSKTDINSTSYKNDDTWASELATFPNPGTVSSLAQEKEYSESLMSFISNYMAMTNTLTDNLTKTISKTGPDRMTYNSSLDSLNKDNGIKTDPLNKNLVQDEFPNKNNNKLTPTDLNFENPAREIVSEPTSDYVTDNIKTYIIFPFDLDKTVINDFNDTITDQNSNDTLTNIDSPTKFTFNDILSDNSVYPISFVSTNMHNDNETFPLTQNDTNTSTTLKNDKYDKNVLKRDEQTIQNMCPINEDTSLETQCYIFYENPDVSNSTSNYTDILPSKLLTNANSKDYLSEDSLNKNTSISNEILDFNDYFTLSPDDSTTDFYDSALSSESIDTKYQSSNKFTTDLVYDVFDIITKSKEQDTSRLATNYLDEPEIIEDSEKDVSNMIEMDKSSSIDTHEVSNEDPSHNIQESSLEEQILNDSEHIKMQNEHDLSDTRITRRNKFEENNKISDLLYNIFPKLEFLM